MSVSAKRNAKIEITSSAAGMDRGLADARRKLRSFERETQRAAKASARAQAREDKQQAKAAAAAKKVSVGAVSGMALRVGSGAVDFIIDAAKGVMDFEKEMTRFSIDAQIGADKTAEFRKQLMETSAATGVSRQSILEGAHAYQILTGDADGAMEASKLFAKVAIASGASMEDIAASAAAMRMNAKLDPKDFQKGFDVLLSMGHKGSVELRDFGGEVAKLMPIVHNFGTKDGMTQWTEMAAGLQGVRKEFGSVEEAATGYAQLMARLKNEKVVERLGAHGIKIWDIDPKTKKNVSRDFMDIMRDIHAKGLDQRQMIDILGGRQEAVRAMNAIQGHWEEIVALKDQAAGSDQVAKDSAAYLESSTGKLAVAWETVKNKIAESLTPDRIDRFAAAMVNAAGAISAAVGALDHVLGWAEKAGKGAATAIGGQSEEDRIANLRGRRYLDRVDVNLQRYDESHVNDNDASDEYNTRRENAALLGTKREDQMRDRLYAQARGENWATAPDPSNMYGAGGRGGKTYSLPELIGLTGMAGNSSDSGATLQALQAAIKQAIKEGFASVPAPVINSSHAAQAIANSSHERMQARKDSTAKK